MVLREVTARRATGAPPPGHIRGDSSNSPREVTTPSDPDIRFEQIYRDNLTRILAYARRRSESPEGAEEVAAETFLVVWRRLGDVPEDPLPWLYGVARHVLSNRRRGIRRQAALLDALAEDVESRPGALAEQAAPEQARDSDLALALSQLDEEDREVLMLIAWEELGYSEAAAALGITESSFSRRLRRARQRLTTQLEKLGTRVMPSTDQTEVHP